MVTDHWSGFVAVINMWLLFLQHDGKSWFGGLSDSPALLPCLSEPCKAKAGGPQVIALNSNLRQYLQVIKLDISGS